MKKAENFFRSLANLREIQGKSPPYDTITLTGMVALFEICFEQSWKAMKEQLEIHGYGERRTGSPMAVIKLAYQAGMIDDEDGWLGALRARNHVAHSYNEKVALSIVKETRETFIGIFGELERELKENWCHNEEKEEMH